MKFWLNATLLALYSFFAIKNICAQVVVSPAFQAVQYYHCIECGDNFIDLRDNNVYPTVKIGNQCWMAKNLAYLPAVVGPATGSFTIPFYYVSGYSGTNISEAKATANYSTYGVLYNWTAVMNGASTSSSNPSGVQGVCPTGWHLPSDAEWTQLTSFLGGDAGGKMKEIGTTQWISPNTGATNETGFSALPGGTREIGGYFGYIGYYGYWWSATENYSYNAWIRMLFYNGSNVFNGTNDKGLGLSVRCIKD